MKILYIANERRGADVAARALHATVPDVRTTWVQTHGSGMSWVQANRDAAAILVESEAHDQRSASFVEQIRSHGLATPVVIVAPQHSEAPLAALGAGADGYVVDGESLEADLPRVVTAAIDRARTRRDILVLKLAELEAVHTDAVQRLARAEQAHQQTEQESASELAASRARLAAVQAQHTASLVREARICAALQERLFELEAALRDANDRRAADAAAAADHLVKRHAEFTAGLEQAAEARESIAKELNAATAALDEAQKARTDDAAAAAAHLARREAELGAALEDAAAGLAALERALSDAQAASEEAGRHAAAQLADAAAHQAALEDQLTREEDTRTVIERSLAAAEAARQESEQRHAAELAAAAMRLADVQSRYDAAVTESAHLARREAELAERLTRESAVRTTLDQDLAESRTVRTTLEQDLAESRIDSARARRRFLHVVSAYRRRARVNRTLLEAQLTRERADSERQLEARDVEIRQMQVERETLQHVVATTGEQVQRLQTTLDEERQGHERARLASESELQRLSAESDRLRESLDQLRIAFHELERIAGEHAVERARLESVVAEREMELSAQSARHLAAEQAAQEALAQSQESHRLALEASSRDIARLHYETSALGDELDATRIRVEALRRETDRVPILQAQLEESRRARRRQFERAPYGLCECTRDGVITHVNHSLVRLLGYRRADDLTGVDFAAIAFECPDDLRWLLERTLNTRKAETVESTWKPRSRRRLVVRLQALCTANDSVEIVVQDITHLRALEDRLRQGQRMEAIGRLASEVAVTCDSLLRDVVRDGDRWLAAVDAAHRHRGAMLLGEVKRAGSFLRQLAAHGSGQRSAPGPTSVHGVLRDLRPVLQRVAGDDIKLLLPKRSASFDVDVERERVERVFVNVAGYARERMPSGGEVRIDLSATVVGGRFTARYPDVRRGPHVVITVAGQRQAVPSDTDGTRAAARPESPPSSSPGVDVGALLELVAGCGGHLWMEAEPAGNMTVKIHLPQRTRDDAAEPAEPAAPVERSERGGRLGRWFRKTSTLAGS
jgi:PAS domain S-box-containing protein